ncbi:hypothetical protein FA95DRAFT_1678180 [Auriscalpium vulgare]|uniref:Uncharacterized protein n=1 Tax=Auriscalpium vulgare TaxID=40419 RepID=A0ACB8RYA0_9AGAM|nr:hypothetical protein FA95DRAFT_1678180 [Auriscalpium vulgare]
MGYRIPSGLFRARACPPVVCAPLHAPLICACRFLSFIVARPPPLSARLVVRVKQRWKTASICGQVRSPTRRFEIPHRRLPGRKWRPTPTAAHSATSRGFRPSRSTARHGRTWWAAR